MVTQNACDGAVKRETIVLMAPGGWPAVTAGCAAPATYEAPTNKQTIYFLAFDKVTLENAEWTVIMPDNWDGLAINATFHWMANDATNNAVVWGIKARAYGDGDAIDQAYGAAATVTDLNGSAAYKKMASAATGDITVGGAPAGGQMVQFRVYRDTADGADTLDTDALLLGVKIEYELVTFTS